jgi:energy-coupling factor transporter ATP-binding protein EcfA2
VAKLILVEGIPGSGKSTTARKIEELLKASSVRVRCFNEGDLHPCDLAWHSCVPLPRYEHLLNTFVQERGVLKKYSSVEEDYAYVTYGKLGLLPDHPLFTELASYEPYNGKVSLEKFKELHFSRWKKFGEQIHDDVTYIFECAYLQNHVVELILTYQKNHEYIKAYMKELIETVRSLEPLLLYLSPTDVEWTINNAAKERKTDHPEIWNDWIDDVIAYLENSNYGKTHNVTGLPGCLEFFEKRQRLELDIIGELPIETYVHEVQIDFKQDALESNTEFLSMLLRH